MADTGVAGGRSRSGFSIGDTLQATFDAAGSNFLTFLVLALLLYSLPALVTTLAFGPPAGGFGGLRPWRLLTTSFVTFATNVLLQAALARGVVTHLSGGRAGVLDCLRPAAAVFLPLLAISVLASLGAMAGLLLLVIPGLLLLLVWSVVAPAEVVERRGVFASFGRSVQLTRDHRLAILVVFIAVWLVAVVIQAIVDVPIQMLGFSGGASAWLLIALVQAAGGAVGLVFTGAAPGAVYYELRRAREGAAPAELAAVFD